MLVLRRNINFVSILVLVLFVLSSEKTVLAVSDRAFTSSRAVSLADAQVEARGDWYNEIGFPRQFFISQILVFNVWLFYILLFLKIFLVLGIWPGLLQTSKEEDELPTLYSSGYGGYGNAYYRYPLWQTYG